MNTKPIGILICDDHEPFRKEVAELLCKDEFIIIGQAADGLALIEQYLITKPDVVLSDISMPLLSGIKAAKIIMEKDPEAKILLMSFDYEEYLPYAYAFGIKGLIDKNISIEELKRALRIVYEGGVYYSEKHLSEK